VTVTVVSVGVVLVGVGLAGVVMLVTMPRAGLNRLRVVVLMVVVAGVPVTVVVRRVHVLMEVPLGEVQPDPHAHECRGEQQRPRDRLAEHDGDDRARERCDGEVGTRSSGAHVPHSHDEQRQAQPVGEEAEDERARDVRGRGQLRTEAEREDQIYRACNGTLDRGQPRGVREGDSTGEVVVQAPAEAGTQDGERRPGAAELDAQGTVITIAPATITAIPSATRRSKFSRNTNHASKAVKTPSAFSSRDAPDAGMFDSPASRSTGPRMPPKRIDPASGNISRRLSRTRGARRATRMMVRPRPEPQYRSPANVHGLTSPRRILANGVPAPKSTADARAA